MKKPTISNLARKLGVSRQAIYTFLEEQELSKDMTDETVFAIEHRFSELGKSKRETAERLEVKELSKDKQVVSSRKVKETRQLTLKEESTCSIRLENAKQEYNFNKQLVTQFQNEIEAYQTQYGTTMITSHNGNATTIPQVLSLKNYLELNMRLSKQIQELEEALDVGGAEDEDMFK